MHTGMNIAPVASSVTPEIASVVADSLVRIIEAAYSAHLDQANIAKALDAFGAAAESQPGMSNVTITGCSVHGGNQFVEVDEDDE